MAKLVCGDVAMEVTTEAVQILGGYGYVRSTPSSGSCATRRSRRSTRAPRRCSARGRPGDAQGEPRLPARPRRSRLCGGDPEEHPPTRFRQESMPVSVPSYSRPEPILERTSHPRSSPLLRRWWPLEHAPAPNRQPVRDAEHRTLFPRAQAREVSHEHTRRRPAGCGARSRRGRNGRSPRRPGRSRPRVRPRPALLGEELGEGERAQVRERLGDRRPREHRRARPRYVPADACEPVAEHVAARAVDLGDLGRRVGGASFIAVIAAIWIGWNVP